MSVMRPFWQKKIEALWQAAPIVWLAGVRRSGKTTLVKTISNAEYFNCDLPSVQEKLENPESFLRSFRSKILILDEIHQLKEATMLLKIAADQFKNIKVLATGSSTLIASKKFKDSLTGRKRNLHFLPILLSELECFDVTLDKRMLYGGLPQILLSQKHDLDFYAEWMDSYFARDVQELFAIEKRQQFLKALDYLLAANASQLEVTKFAQAAGVSRPTAIKYLEIFELTHVISLVRPFSGNSEQELVSQSKVYGFDTGFCCYVQGIRQLGPNDVGPLLENLTLESFQAHGMGRQIMYWRTKQQKEIDFVLPLNKKNVLAIECKWKEKNLSTDAIIAFRNLYPQGANWVVTHDSSTRTKLLNGHKVRIININDLSNEIEKLKAGKR